MKHRQDLPLSLIAAVSGESIEGRTRLQKLIFLIQKRANKNKNSGIPDEYEFVPYDYGPFSKEIYDDIDKLVSRGLVEERPEKLDDGVITYNYTLTDKGREFVRENNLLASAPDELNAVASSFGDSELDDIIDFVYDNYPAYAENSLIR